MKWVNENYLNDNINYSYKLSLLSDLVKILGITGYYTLVPLIFKSTYGKKKKSLVIINGSTQKPANVFQLFIKFNIIQPGYLLAFTYHLIYLLEWNTLYLFVSNYSQYINYLGWIFLAIHIILICFRPNSPSLADKISGTSVVKKHYSEIEEIGKEN